MTWLWLNGSTDSYEFALTLRIRADGSTIGESSCLAGCGLCCFIRTYDERNNVIRESYYGPYGKLVISSAGYAEIKRVYDRRSNCIEELYLAPSSGGADALVPIANADGHFGIARSYSFDGSCRTKPLLIRK